MNVTIKHFQVYDGELTEWLINRLHTNVNASRVLLFVCLFAEEDPELRDDHFLYVDSSALSASPRGEPVLTSRGSVLSVRFQMSDSRGDVRYKYIITAFN